VLEHNAVTHCHDAMLCSGEAIIDAMRMSSDNVCRCMTHVVNIMEQSYYIVSSAFTVQVLWLSVIQRLEEQLRNKVSQYYHSR